MVDLKSNPFFLSDDDIAWVNATLENMTEDEKIGQLFCPASFEDDYDQFKTLAKGLKPSGYMCRSMPAETIVKTVSVLQENSKIPMLIAANLESGGTGIVQEGTVIGSPMQIAATDDETCAYRLGVVCAREAGAAGVNWSFAPIIDIDYNFRNPITNTRTFGSDPERVRRMALQYIQGLQENGVAATIKHFPGDGRDERDQHLVTTINDMTSEQWRETYGAIYQACIDAGVFSVMIGHIALPEYTKELLPGIRDEDILPASVSRELTTTLLRETLGFNGLIVSDASTMAGMFIQLTREEAVPRTIMAGCDVFLIPRNLQEDLDYMKGGLRSGLLTRERLDEAVLRILAMKAALKLHKKKEDGSLIPSLPAVRAALGNSEYKRWARACADRAITLVKQEQGVLPISREKYPKILFYPIEGGEGFIFKDQSGATKKIKALLELEGFVVDTFEPGNGAEGMVRSYQDIANSYDLLLYVACMMTKSNQTVVRIEWQQPMGANVPTYINKVPTIFISLENPYHLIDVPRVKTFINTYSSSDTVIEALIEKLTGRSDFYGKSPADVFCGKWDTRL